MSNDISPPLLVENVPYRSMEQMHELVRRWCAEHCG
jgi:hypothetical protein